MENYLKNPSAIMLRSHKLKNSEVDKSVLAIARCGAGTNNIPIDKMTYRGIPVFNTPGANANSVKELVLCSMFLSARDINGSINHIQNLTDSKGFEFADKQIEKDKKLFSGTEIKGKTLGVIGLGAIGSKVAMASSSLGMKVIGYDPKLTVESVWNLDGNKVKRVNNIENCIECADYISLHIPVIKGVTENLINSEMINIMKTGANLLNFSRSELVDHSALRKSIDNGQFTGKYCTDFPDELIQGHKQCISIPHLGASTKEAEDNSAIMATNTIMDFLENGTIQNSVNFPTTLLKKRKKNKTRICIVNENKSGMLMEINNVLYKKELNIDQQINKSREKIAYNVIDVDKSIKSEEFIQLHNKLEKIKGILSVRIISGNSCENQSYRSKNLEL
jgi:D-3-phosphoglycerate dehydrogenase